MEERIGTFQSEDQFLQDLMRAHIASDTEGSGGTATGGIRETTKSAVIAESPRELSLKFDVHLTYTKEWSQEFLRSTPSQRSIMLAQILEAYSDGVEGIYLSFSEPVVSE